jgi:hypothetical protein
MRIGVMRIFLAVTATLPLFACGPQVVVMQNPQTKEVHECRHDPWGSIIDRDVSECVSGYEKAGWIRME